MAREDQLRAAGIGLWILKQTNKLCRQQRMKVAAKIVDREK